MVCEYMKKLIKCVEPFPDHLILKTLLIVFNLDCEAIWISPRIVFLHISNIFDDLRRMFFVCELPISKPPDIETYSNYIHFRL